MVSENLNMQREAIIYVPGLGEWIDHSLEGFAQRFSLEVRRNTRNPQARFVIESALEGEEPISLPGKDVKISMCSVHRLDGDQKLASIDIYKFDYATTMAKRFERKNLLMKVLYLLFGILINLPRVFYAIIGRNRPKHLSEIIQVLFGVGTVTLLIIYMFILGIAVVETVERSPQVKQLISQVLPVSTFSDEPELQDESEKVETLTLAQTLVILLALLEVFVPEVRKMIEKAAVDNLCILDYLSLGERQNVIFGGLEDLLRALSNAGIYREINMVAFSFGSIIALDNLFPYGKQQREGAPAVNTLITIGCPFDLVRTFWPRYFQGRQVSTDVPKRWFNIFSPIDVLASKFDATKGADSAILTRKPSNIAYTGGFNQANLSTLAWLTLIGLRAHTAYWEKDSYTSANCMKDVVVNLCDEKYF